MNISVNAPSYRRPDDVRTLAYLPFTRIWVDHNEYEAYKASYPDADIIGCPDGVQGNLCRVRNYILREEFKRGMDVVLIIDDDFTCLRRFDYDGNENWGYVPHVITEEEFLPFLEKYSVIADDMGAKFWGVNCNCDPMAYRHNTPFSTRSYIGGPFQCFLKGNRCYYDENLPLKEDYDMTLQQLNMERVVLRVNSYHYICEQSTNKGGLAAYRNRDREYEQCEMLIKKWGGAYFQLRRNEQRRHD
jgi:hypothetical protein